MDTMETIEVATGLSTELKIAVAVCVVLATMLVLTLVSSPSRPREQPERRARGTAHALTAQHAHTMQQTPSTRARTPLYRARARDGDVT
jgi:hypothetical protein